jgi:hypothetical protein
VNPQFPIYVISKGRWSENQRLTSRYLEQYRVQYHIIVEKQERAQYCAVIDEKKVLTLPPEYKRDYDTFDDLGDEKSKGPGAARNFAWDHAISSGSQWHWVMDDNIRGFYRLNLNLKIPVGDGTIFRAMEDFCLRYKNVAMAGPNYYMFAPRKVKQPPFIMNTRIYSCNLIRNDTMFRWRGRYNEDTDLSLRMLKAGWCTVQFNAFLQDKETTQHMQGGNTADFYMKEGTLPKSRMLVSMHPDVSELVWKFGRWHHSVDYRAFKNNRLVRKPDAKVGTTVDNFGMKLVQMEESTNVAKAPTPFTAILRKQKVKQVVPDSVMAETSKDALRRYMEFCARHADVPVDRAYDITLGCLKFHDGKTVDHGDIAEWLELKARWYASLSAPAPDYSVYSSPFYFCELWLCWAKYSRKYLHAIGKDSSMVTKSIASDFGELSSILDLGCGFGYTTAALKEMFPKADVSGTNLEGTSQFRMAAELGAKHGFEMFGDHRRKADLIFASEYFEHIDRPLEHLDDVLTHCHPKFLLVANSFDTDAIGHFKTYKHLEGVMPSASVGRLFGQHMRARGYELVKTKCWNNRPAYWRRTT